MKDYNELSRKAYNKIAANYNDTFDGKFTVKFKQLLLKWVKAKKGDKLLDVACGTGELLHLLKDLYEVSAFGVDIAENMIKTAKSLYPDIFFEQGNSSNLNFEDGFFDAVTVCAAFHHFPEPEKFLLEAFRVLKPGGSLYIADIYYPPILRQFFNILIPLYNSGDVKCYSKNQLSQLLKKAGYELTHLETNANMMISQAKKPDTAF